MELIPSSIKIGVIRGGKSDEYDISLLSGANIIENLMDTHKPIDIFVSKDGTWHVFGVEKSPERILKNIDVVWNSLHGEFGEDGKIQDILQHHGVKFTGSDRYSSSISHNKFLAKEYLKNLGIKTPTYAIVRQTDDLKERSKEIFSSIPGPLIIKPVNSGSSLGIKVTKTYDQLFKTLYEILSSQSDAIVEELISGKEGVVGVIDNFRGQEHYSLPPIEIVHKNSNGFFDYKSRISGGYEEYCPGNFSESEKRELENLAKKIHKHLGLRHFSKTDFIISPKRGIYFIETNTSPKLTKDSHFSKALESVGSNIKEFIHHVLNLSINS